MFLIASFLFPADSDSVLTLTNNIYAAHIRHTKTLHLTQKTHLYKIYFYNALSFIVVLNYQDEKIGQRNLPDTEPHNIIKTKECVTDA